MCAQIGWNESSPPDTESAGLGDDRIRSLLTSVRIGMDDEHVWPSAGGDAGKHRLGSAKVFVGTQSAVSSSGTDGRLMWASDTSRMFHVGSGGTVYLGGPLGLSLGTTIGFSFPQHHYWAEELGIASTDSTTGTVVVSLPNSGYSGCPYVFLSSLRTTNPFQWAISYSTIDGSSFKVWAWDTFRDNAATDQVAFCWRSLGTRCL